ncbi:hypothetical protein LVD15_16520 [Fulvivirga maritima]|uniref:hypothetical protein n=1 Tax=Fulvivirga maritima TaxID=2904247 RepID=UPI001F3086EA|nr:hypothetical protein [Fulvivirga maritima]UII24904.1 hypothetical protein LVD15_16520 [Fulvivirga maritima]
MMRKVTFLLLIICITASRAVYAQSYTIRGRVADTSDSTPVTAMLCMVALLYIIRLTANIASTSSTIESRY